MSIQFAITKAIFITKTIIQLWLLNTYVIFLHAPQGYTLYDTLDIVVHDFIGSPGLIIHHVVVSKRFSELFHILFELFWSGSIVIFIWLSMAGA